MMRSRANDKELQDKKKFMQQWAIDQGLVEGMIDKLEQDSEDEDVRTCCPPVWIVHLSVPQMCLPTNLLHTSPS